ncbi:MAG: NERD domain-containing protein, partial [Lysobacteraceae bacterium]
MATLHPTVHAAAPLGAGAYRERDVLHALELGLPRDWDIFHNVDWAAVRNGRPHIGEVDIAVVSPGGFLLLVEVKAGSVQQDEHRLVKRYGGGDEGKDIGAQLRRMHSALLSRLKDAGLRDVRVGTLLVLPDHRLTAPVLAHAPEGVVDAAGFPELARRVQQLAHWEAADDSVRERLLDFLANRFHVVPDVSSWIGQVQRNSTAMTSGLATWVPEVRHASGRYVVHATAGAGKTQLALALLRQASGSKLRCAYVCISQPLAAHIARLVPATVQVATLDALAADDQSTQMDLLVLDEHQDLDAARTEALRARVVPGGRAYVLGDVHQQTDDRPGFALRDAVVIRCLDNFRSPRKVVEAINQLRLTDEPVVARSPFAGEVPGFHTHDAAPGAALAAVEAVVRGLLDDGVPAAQMAVLSCAGAQPSAVREATLLAGLSTRRRNEPDDSRMAVWSEGELLVEAVERFKG